jgi:hypothetical protein
LVRGGFVEQRAEVLEILKPRAISTASAAAAAAAVAVARARVAPACSIAKSG